MEGVQGILYVALQRGLRYRPGAVVSQQQQRVVPKSAWICQGGWVYPGIRFRFHDSSSSFVGHSLSWYRFIGRILGKAIYEGILVDVAFAGFFLAKVDFNIVMEPSSVHTYFQWLGRQNLLDDLASLDPRIVQWAHVPQALYRKPGRPVAKLHGGH